MAERLRVLGVDPGSLHTGYALIDVADGELQHVDNGMISPNPRAPFAERLGRLCDGLAEVIAKYGPTEAAIEEIFYARNVKSAMRLGEARGAALVALFRCGLPISEYPATVVKQAVTGFGRAEKQQVAAMTARLVGLAEPAAADAADALAVAICHANCRRFQERTGLSPAGLRNRK